MSLKAAPHYPEGICTECGNPIEHLIHPAIDAKDVDLRAENQRLSEELEKAKGERDRQYEYNAGKISEYAVLEQQNQALREGLERLVSYVNLDLAAKKQGGHGFPTRILEALASAEGLLGDAEACFICHKPKGQPPERCPGHYEATAGELRPIQVGDTVRHRTQGWTQLVSATETYAEFVGGGFWRLSQLERVDHDAATGAGDAKAGK